MSQRVTYRCSGCGKRLIEQRGRVPAQMRHFLGAPGDYALLCGLFVRAKGAPRELREAWRDIGRGERVERLDRAGRY